MAFCLHYSLALSAGFFVNAVETASDILAWKLDRDGGMLEQGIHKRLKGHEGQVSQPFYGRKICRETYQS